MILTLNFKDKATKTQGSRRILLRVFAPLRQNKIFKIHTTLGSGLLDGVYESAFAYELDKRGIPYTRQQHVPVHYDEMILDVGFRADIIMDDKLLIEIKSIEHLEKVHHKTVLTYLKLTNIKLALFVNFNVNLIKEGIHRKIHGTL